MTINKWFFRVLGFFIPILFVGSAFLISRGREVSDFMLVIYKVGLLVLIILFILKIKRWFAESPNANQENFDKFLSTNTQVQKISFILFQVGIGLVVFFIFACLVFISPIIYLAISNL